MEENKPIYSPEDEHSNVPPINEQQLNPPSTDEPIVPDAETSDLINPTSEIKDMEVHHHSHESHGKKNWKSYFWEFLMLFLAVFCGFLAEYQLEHKIEKDREKEFAKTLYSELLDDSAAAATKMIRRLEKEKDMNYLSSYLKDSSLTNLPKDVYPAYITSLYLINTYSFEPKDGILSQLRNSGSLRYIKSIALQKLLGDISVNINDVRIRNEQEYQFFANPIKPFLLKYFDWSWIDNIRKEDTSAVILDVLNNYRKSSHFIESKILNLATFNRVEASNMILFYKQMMVSTRTLQMNNYILTNHKILEELRKKYKLE